MPEREPAPPACPAELPTAAKTWRCELVLGHDGPHVTAGGAMRWPVPYDPSKFAIPKNSR